ncbi:MAG: hypothetical protein RIG62_25920 [Cyclobacteriaceae bacterium]
MHRYLLSFIVITPLFISCQEDEEAVTPPAVTDTLTVDTDSTITVDLSGYIQKGPFINGTAITVSELDSTLTTTGKNFTTQITDNKGSFRLNRIKLQSNFVQLQADGFYFDEVKGAKSAAQLTLFALSQVEDVSSINANLLSHMERTRVLYLMQVEEKDFTEAKVQAQQEILAVFGIQQDAMAQSELLDISQDGEDNAILLAISAILQADNTVAELSELVANIMTDLQEDGTLDSQTNKDKISAQAKGLDLLQIRSNLQQRYEELGLQATIPNFEQYIDSDGDGILNKDEDDTPENFTFEIQTDVAINDTLTSNTITISGLKEGGTANASIRHGHLMVNGNLREDTVAQIKNGDRLQLQLRSGNAFTDTTQAILTIGTLVRHFQVVTDDYIPNAFSFTTQKDVAIDAYYTSHTITVSGLPYPTPARIYDGILIKNGEEITGDSTSVVNGDELAIKVKSSTEFMNSTAAMLEINTVAANFEVITDDYSPNGFNFKSVTAAKRSTLYISDTITISGLPYPTPPGIAWFSSDSPVDGAIYVNGTKYSDNSFSLKEGDKVWIELTSAEEYSATISSSLVINDKEAFFNLITETSPWQRKADFPNPDAGRLDTGFEISGKLYIVTSNGELFVYNPETNQWIEKAKYKGAGRGRASSFALNGKGYICLGTDTADYSTLHKELWEYDPTADSWKKKTNFPGASRMFQTVFTANNKAYLGWGEVTTTASEGGTPAKDFWRYDPAADIWTQMSDFPGQARTGAFAISSSGNPLFGSGWSESIEMERPYFNLFSDLWEYHPLTDSWTKKNDINFLPIGFFALEDKIHIYCEESYPYETSGLYQYNASQDTWVFAEESFREQNGSGGFYSINNKGYVLTSYDGIWEYTPPLK